MNDPFTQVQLQLTILQGIGFQEVCAVVENSPGRACWQGLLADSSRWPALPWMRRIPPHVAWLQQRMASFKIENSLWQWEPFGNVWRHLVVTAGRGEGSLTGIWWTEARDTAMRPIMHRTALTTVFWSKCGGSWLWVLHRWLEPHFPPSIPAALEQKVFLCSHSLCFMNEPWSHWGIGLFGTLSPFCSLSRKCLNTALTPLLSIARSWSCWTYLSHVWLPWCFAFLVGCACMPGDRWWVLLSLTHWSWELKGWKGPWPSWPAPSDDETEIQRGKVTWSSFKIQCPFNMRELAIYVGAQCSVNVRLLLPPVRRLFL